MNTATQEVYFVLTGLPEITEEALTCPEGLREYVEQYIADDDTPAYEPEEIEEGNLTLEEINAGELDWLLGILDDVDWKELREELEKC